MWVLTALLPYSALAVYSTIVRTAYCTYRTEQGEKGTLQLSDLFSFLLREPGALAEETWPLGKLTIEC